MTARKYKFICRKRGCDFKSNDEFEAAAHYWGSPKDHKVKGFDPWSMPSVEKKTLSRR